MRKLKPHILVVILMLAFACSKDKVLVPNAETPKNESGTISFVFNNLFDTLPLQYDSVNYILDNGEKFKVTTFKYYISNIQLISTDGKIYSEPESYHLINGKDSSSLNFSINNIPIGNYKEIKLLIGVDSTRNVSGTQSGALDINNDMFWSWNTGYIMAKMEGFSQQSPNSDNSFGFHIGGFKGTNNALQQVSFNISSNPLTINNNSLSTIKLNCDIKEWFVNPATLSFTNFYNVTSVNNDSKTIATNYGDMLSILSIN